MRPLLLALLLLAGCAAPAASPPERAEGEAAALACDPCRVVMTSADFGLREPAVAVDPLDPDHLLATTMGFDVVGDAPVGKLRLRVQASENGGRTWTPAPFALPDATPATQTYDGTPLFLPDGTSFVGGIALEGAYSLMGPVQGDARVFAWREGAAATVAAGRGAEVPALGLGAALEAPDKPAFAVSEDGRMLAAWAVRVSDGAATSIRFEAARSDDAGRTWKRITAPVDEGAAPGAIVAHAGGWAMTYVTFTGIDDVRARRYECWLAESDGKGWRAQPLGACNGFPALAAGPDGLAVALPREDSLALVEGPRETIVRAFDAAHESIPAVLALPEGALVTFYAPGGAYEAALARGGAIVARLALDDGVGREPGSLGDYFGLARVPGGAVATWIGEEGDGVAAVLARILVSGN